MSCLSLSFSLELYRPSRSMWGFSVIRRQLQKQPFMDSIGYSAAFAPATERPVDAYQMATALYSPAATQLRRRKGHYERQKKYTSKAKLVSCFYRNGLGMNAGD